MICAVYLEHNFTANALPPQCLKVIWHGQILLLLLTCKNISGHAACLAFRQHSVKTNNQNSLNQSCSGPSLPLSIQYYTMRRLLLLHLWVAGQLISCLKNDYLLRYEFFQLFLLGLLLAVNFMKLSQVCVVAALEKTSFEYCLTMPTRFHASSSA